MAAKKRPSSSGDDKPGRPVGNNKRYDSEFVEYPSGKKRRLNGGSSPWQRRIEDRRIELNLSLRAIADKTNGKVSFNGLWQWLRNPEGHPLPRNYTAAVNAALARALDLAPETLAGDYEAAKMANGLRSTTSTTRDSTKLALLRKLILEGKATWPRKDIIDLIDGLSS